MWATLISAYEDYGYPDRAIASMPEALAARSDDSYLLSFSVGFWGRMGLKEKESKSLAALQNATNRVHFYTAAVSHYRRIGNWPKALENCRYWLSEEPNNIAARREYASLWAMAKGMQSALALIRKWMDAKPGNDDLELIYYNYLKDLFKDDEQLAVLRLRLKRNPYDTWAYRELAFTLLDVMDTGGNREQEKTRIELGQAIQKCQELCPNQAAFFVIKGELAAHDGHHKVAIKHYLEALNLDPEYHYAYGRAWKLSGEFSENVRRQLFGQLEKRMLRCTGFLYVANDLAEMAANHYGGREAHQIVDRWLRNFPDDPEVAMAKANLLLYNGQGKTDAREAVNLLEVQVVRFPNHAGLRATLSIAYRTLQDEEKWMTCSRELLKQFPLRISERRQLAEYYQGNNDLEHAIRILVEGIRFLPLNHELRLRLITLLFQKGEKEKALAFVKGSLAKIPEDVKFREEIIELLFTNSESKLALEVAEEGTTVYPDGAVLWRIYADALWRSDLTSNMKAVETAYQKALTLNPRYLEAADRLAEFYAYQSRFDEARKICENQKPFHIQTGEIPTRLAWIERVAGKKDEALMQLTEVVRQWPRERWAWGLLLAWIQEDSNWELATEVLQNVHPVMLEDPQFVGDKLCVLHKAGVQNRKTEKEWARILNDFLENERIYSQRFDLLLEDQKLQEAELVLKAIQKFSVNSPYILARKTALKADQRQFDQAFAAARSLMALPYFVGDWCGQQVWKAFQDHAKLPYLIQRGLQEWEEGLETEPNFCRMLVKDLDYVVKRPDSFARFLSFLGFPSRLEKRLQKLLEKSLQRDDQHGSLTAAILDKLEDIGKRRFLIKFAQKHKHFAQTHKKVWQIVGHALLVRPGGKSDEAWRWFENWRQRSGCELWCVSNLIIAIENSKKLKSPVKLHSIYKNTADALEILPADHTQQYMVCKYCEATLRLGRSEDFLAAVRRFENLLHDTESGYWQQQGDTHLPWVILEFRRLLETDNIEVLNRLKKVFFDEIKNRQVGDWVRAEWKKHMRQVEKDLRGSAAAQGLCNL